MYGFHVKWLTRRQLPPIPATMLFSGTHHDAPGPDGDFEQAVTPVITWGNNSLGCVFDDNEHHDAAWLVVYGDGEQLTGAHPLPHFRHVMDIQAAPSGVAWVLVDEKARKVEISHLLLDGLDGRVGRETSLEGMPVGIPFCLRNGRDFLMADESGVRVAALPDPLAMQWMYQDGELTHVATQQVLGLGVRCKPAAQDGDRWHLSARGVLFYGEEKRALCADPGNGDVWLQAHVAESPEGLWQVQMPGQTRRNRGSALRISTLAIHVQVSNDLRSGTSDAVYFSVNGSAHRQLLARNFDRGSLLQVDVDLSSMFAGRQLVADELHSVELYQVSGEGYGPAWRMQSLDLVVNDELSNRLLVAESPWLLPARGASWKGVVNWLDWRLKGKETPLDFTGRTYPVTWRPLLSDWLYWRSYDVSNIEGVCQLIGEQDGRVLGFELVGQRPVYLEPNTANDSYTWVYTPQGSIIVKRWDKAAPRAHYITHSQLGMGAPVVCAGEMTIVRMGAGVAVHDILGMINDASGHYVPDGGACLAHVRERLAQLGLDTTRTTVAFHSGKQAE
ncbi:hypothetical protein C4Q28_09885 [Pseudomonas sp. SWI6]|uniref:Uncharacterized protein n=1 Tax=Pseudomonas taiwanensis TaxID=470150 RepID=A0ABR6V0Q4_9PSED|nr:MULTISPECIES: hypothetical protein [Pseudomonas]AGZ36058.1 hypothetical protein PVLB_16375 [Pseudomonas sp. VLB120]AVD82444.1 hypothetical protein C4Q28_09885 [Pseudomonas sp. SWI6]AVD89395.1 hypothetical protein C4Q26_20590 [Pseudomonas sp. SWI44]MBC3473988.1 hypothetical protein [Pseudomonas taiwanensis]MBC3491374.1 hypothetical protein [Pseudomonas taiwanensis]